METYRSEKEYLDELEKRAIVPEGFLVSTGSLKFFPVERKVTDPLSMNLSLIVTEEPTPLFGAVFTRNAFPGAPIVIGKKRLSSKYFRGVIINNRIANVRAPNGIEDAESVLRELSRILQEKEEYFFPSSTGIIGWKIPVEEIIKKLPELVRGLNKKSLLPVARAIMTTDSFPKLRSEEVGEGVIVGVAKGAGMIEPNMGTMLSYILTDIEISKEFLREVLKECVDKSFNRISIDGDQSTSDTVMLISSGKKSKVSENLFYAKLLSVCEKLSEDIVRNGEGVAHVIEVSVKNAGSESLAKEVGKAIVNSPLVKTAVFGNDPNVGRIVSSVGDLLGNKGVVVNPDRVRIAVGEEVVFENGYFTLDAIKENRLVEYLKSCYMNPENRGYPEHDKKVKIEVDLGMKEGVAVVIGSDLSYQYVRENADYRS